MKILRLPSITSALAMIILLGAATAAWPQEMLTNGNFELDLSTGWTIDSLPGMSPALDTIDRDTLFEPDPDFEVRLRKYDSAYNRLYQTVPVTNAFQMFSFRAKMEAVETNPAGTYWIIASITLSYMNAADSILGETRIISRTPHCTYSNTANFHMIDVVDTTWNDYAINIWEEMANLPGINPTDIAKIRVALFDTSNGC